MALPKAKAELAAELGNIGVSQREQLRAAGYDETQIAIIEGEVMLDQAQAALDDAADPMLAADGGDAAP